MSVLRIGACVMMSLVEIHNFDGESCRGQFMIRSTGIDKSNNVSVWQIQVFVKSVHLN